MLDVKRKGLSQFRLGTHGPRAFAKSVSASSIKVGEGVMPVCLSSTSVQGRRRPGGVGALGGGGGGGRLSAGVATEG